MTDNERSEFSFIVFVYKTDNPTLKKNLNLNHIFNHAK
jgi:hypothetical protein